MGLCRFDLCFFFVFRRRSLFFNGMVSLAAVRLFWTGRRPMVLSSNGFASSLMDSKGNVGHFFGVVFASHFSRI